uniref:Phosphatidylinositol N-acetylglucosaminyltransferase subunit Q n=1 Tax=Branchiostoma floridae TaxID=7739 RepID=C3YC93_BRAFL|eukprot:XP_002606115.1 hypothetical protein BRAFLDRAFT_88025 [Branchiostoma floridae]
MKVFIPRCCLTARSGWLVGWQDEDLEIVCIFTVLHPTSGLKISDINFHACTSRMESPVCVLYRGRVCDLTLSLVLDVLLGVAVFLFLSKGNYTKTLATNLIPFADYVASELQALLHWLMGAPAGLKLNRPLDEFLGRFFLYHIQLWIGYLYILRPYLELITWCIGLSGCLGLSVLLALASDTLSMLTFHIYCFYVYAARLFPLPWQQCLRDTVCSRQGRRN